MKASSFLSIQADSQKKGPQDRQRSFLVVGLSLLSVGALLVLQQYWLKSSNALTLILLVFFIYLTMLPFLRAKSLADKVDYLEIIYPLSLFFLLDYGFRTIYVLWRPDLPEVRFRPWLLDTALLNTTLSYLVLGYIALLLGYYSKVPSFIAQHTPNFFKKEWPQRYALPKVVFIYCFGLLVAAFGYATGDSPFGPVGPGKDVTVSALHDYIQSFSQYVWYAVAAGLFSGAFFHSPNGRWTAIVMALVPLTLVFLGGSKGRLYLLILMLLIWVNYRRSLIKPKVFVLLGVCSLLFIFPWVNMYRSTYRQFYGDELNKTHLANALTANFENITSRNPAEHLERSLGIMMERQHSVDALAATIAQTPKPNPYLWGKDFLTIFTSLVPRAVWPRKPFPQDGVVFDFYYWHMPGRCYAGPPFIGDMYMNFGLPGVILGMFVLGILLRSVYLYLVRDTGAAGPGLLYYAVWMPQCLRIATEGAMADFGGLAKISVFYLFFIHIFMRKL